MPGLSTVAHEAIPVLSALIATLHRMYLDIPGSLRELAEFQVGVLTSSQALGGGLTMDAIRWRLRTGRWHRMHVGVYATFSGDPGRQTALWAAVLRAGDGAMLSYHTAAELFGLVSQPSSLIHITIPGDRRVRAIPGLVLRVAARAELARHPALAPPRTRLEETVLDLADVAASAEEAYGWVATALGRRLTTQPRLIDALGMRKRICWQPELTTALTADWQGVHSALEIRYVRDVERPHKLPQASRQVRVRRGTLTEYRDILYDEYAVAVELDGRAAHPGDTRWSDIRRDNAAAADGVFTPRYGWIDVSQHPCLVAKEVASALRQRGYSGARPCSPACARSWRG